MPNPMIQCKCGVSVHFEPDDRCKSYESFVKHIIYDCGKVDVFGSD